MTGPGRITRLLRIERSVASLDAACAFYRDAFGFTVGAAATRNADGRTIRSALLQLGAQQIALMEYSPPGAPYPADGTAADLWFQHFAIVVADMTASYDRLRRLPHTPITLNGPQTLPPSTGGVTAYKFRDPDGHPLELLAFPPAAGKVAPGIDHSAISVADAGRSIKFYTSLGLTVAAQQTNRGLEQERLDALTDDMVEVVALEPGMSTTPHLELLAYQTPRGRPLASPGLPWDIAGDCLVFAVDDLAALRARLPGLLTTVCRDPDGHLLRLEAEVELHGNAD